MIAIIHQVHDQRYHHHYQFKIFISVIPYILDSTNWYITVESSKFRYISADRVKLLWGLYTSVWGDDKCSQHCSYCMHMHTLHCEHVMKLCLFFNLRRGIMGKFNLLFLCFWIELVWKELQRKQCILSCERKKEKIDGRLWFVYWK